MSDYKSQFGQDRYLNEKIFKNKKNGVFVDIGAHDGITLSNTFFFEKNLGWSGLCIEPIPSVFGLLCNNRNCVKINGCAWNENTKKKFRIIEGYSEMLSGIIDAYPEEHLNRISGEIEQFDQTYRDVEVDCFNTYDLLLSHGLRKIDLFSIDIEGGEFDVLKTIDFNIINIEVILVENNYEDENIRNFLKKNGYLLDTTLTIDDVFVKNV